MKKLLMCFVFLLSSCSTYDLGDSVVNLRSLYCGAVPQDIRDKAIERMKESVEEYPDKGICWPDGLRINFQRTI